MSCLGSWLQTFYAQGLIVVFSLPHTPCDKKEASTFKHWMLLPRDRWHPVTHQRSTQINAEHSHVCVHIARKLCIYTYIFCTYTLWPCFDHIQDMRFTYREMQGWEVTHFKYLRWVSVFIVFETELPLLIKYIFESVIYFQLSTSQFKMQGLSVEGRQARSISCMFPAVWQIKTANTTCLLPKMW